MLRGGHKAPKRNQLWLAAWLAPVCPITTGVSSAQLTQAVAGAGCSALKDTSSITQNPAFIFIPFCGEQKAKVDWSPRPMTIIFNLNFHYYQ